MSLKSSKMEKSQTTTWFFTPKDWQSRKCPVSAFFAGERKFAIKYRGRKHRNMFNQRTAGQVSLCNPEASSWVQLIETSSCLVESKTVKFSSPTHTHVRQPNRYSQRVSIAWLSCNSLQAELMSVARTFFGLVCLKISQKRRKACECLSASNWCSSCRQTPSRGQTAEG